MEPQKELNTKLLAFFLQKSYRDDKPVTLLESEVIPGARVGDNYGSDVLRVKMKFICGSGKIKRRSMIIKTERNWNELSKIMESFPIFRSEVRMYSSIFGLMEDLMEEFDDKRGNLWPKMYGFLPYHLIAMEDLKESQYMVADRKKSLDLNHALLVLRSLARFHAMTKVLIGRGLLTKEDKGAYPQIEKGGVMEAVWSSLLTVFSDGIQDSWGEEWYDLSEKLRKLKDGAVYTIRDLAVNFDSRFEVLSHADSWVCNMMFRYLEYENIPISVKFIDFQGSFTSSFIWDVSYFMITSVFPSIRRENTAKLLEAYCEALSTNLEFFGYTGYFPTLDDVKSEWKRIHFSQLVFLGLHALMSSEASVVFDMSKVMTHQPNEVYDIKAFTDGKAKRNIGDDLKYYHAEGIF